MFGLGFRSRVLTFAALATCAALIAAGVALAQSSEPIASSGMPAPPVVECVPPKPAVTKQKQAQISLGRTDVCFAPPAADRTCLKSHKLCDKDMAVAAIAWKYFENN